MICTIDLLNEENNSISNFSKEMIFYEKGNFFYIHLPLFKHESCYKIKFWLRDNNIFTDGMIGFNLLDIHHHRAKYENILKGDRF